MAQSGGAQSARLQSGMTVPVRMGGALTMGSLVFVALVRLTGAGPLVPVTGPIPGATQDQSAGVAPRVSRDLRFEDRPDGAVAAFDATTNAPVAMVPAGTNGFIRATLRGLAHERMRFGGSAAQPFRLSVWDDGRVRLQDLATGRTVALEAFGATNRQAFADLIMGFPKSAEKDRP